MASPLTLTTPLAPGTLTVTGFTGTESLSRLFSFDVKCEGQNAASVPFEQIVGQPVTLSIALPGSAGGIRFVNGFVSRFSAGQRNATSTEYRAEIVPQLWLLSRNQNSRIFQGKSTPEIVESVLSLLPDLDFDMRLQGNYAPREYCVQYRESDFDFASRLMEEEGIFYFFEHADGAHQMVIGDTQPAFPSVPQPGTVMFSPTAPTKPNTTTVLDWEKTQELGPGKTTLWDHHFELPGGGNHLEATAIARDTVRVGTVTHHLRIAGNDKLEMYDYPGGYAKRFDGIDPHGGEDPTELSNIQPTASRLAAVRQLNDDNKDIAVKGTANCRQFTGGHTFGLKGHFNGNGKYLLTSVTHRASVTGDPTRATQANVDYHNQFECIPTTLPYRPSRLTPQPFVHGSQTAVVVGPAGEEIFTDKYGRIKVKFHWDREGNRDENSSCWVRVGALHAGEEQGFLAVPRIGQEVIVAFLEGDPDQPIIVGSVYNAERPPPTPGPDGGA